MYAQLSVMVLWLVLIKAVRWAVFPFNSKFITNGHHKDLNMRLTMEMLRLIKGVNKILQSHMQLDPELVNKSAQGVNDESPVSRGSDHFVN